VLQTADEGMRHDASDQLDCARECGRTLAMPVVGGLHRQYFRA